MLRKIFYQLPPDEAAELEEALVVTDSQSCIDRVRESWDALGDHDTEIYPIIGVETNGRKLSGCNYVVENMEDLDEEFFDRIYRRVHRMPWTVIETAHCTIRETTQDDLDRFYEMYGDPAMTAFMDDLYREKADEAAYLREYQDKIYAFYGFGVWSIVEKHSGMVIGRARISMREGYEEPELGFCIDRNYRRRGYAREVCEAILRFMRDEYETPVIQALVRPGNQASVNLLKGLGFTYCEKVWVDGRIHERFLFHASQDERKI